MLLVLERRGDVSVLKTGSSGVLQVGIDASLTIRMEATLPRRCWQPVETLAWEGRTSTDGWSHICNLFAAAAVNSKVYQAGRYNRSMDLAPDAFLPVGCVLCVWKTCQNKLRIDSFKKKLSKDWK